MIGKLVRKILAGQEPDVSEIAEAAAAPNAQDLYDAAHKITVMMAPRDFEMCSIINAKSGACSEDCKWCAQSAHHNTSASVYGFVGADTCLDHARRHEAAGVARFSVVTSGRSPDPATMDEIVGAVCGMKTGSGIQLCASLGLVDVEGMKRLRESGVVRYHCNLETAPSFFGELCGTHSAEDKMATLRAAREAGLELCSGGIIGMGETFAHRIELAFALRGLGVKSIPLNLLHPIPGTPLGHMDKLPEEDVLRTVAMFRLVNPEAHLRLAGGSANLSPDGVKRALYAGINAAIVGDLLTTVGADVAEYREYADAAGYMT